MIRNDHIRQQSLKFTQPYAYKFDQLKILPLLTLLQGALAVVFPLRRGMQRHC